MFTYEDNYLLTRVEGDAPMGQMMRRFWTPAAMSEEVSEPGGTPRRIRLFGEDLVLFRGLGGAVGLLDEHCPHRRASLVLGRVGDCTLTCLYHGWKIRNDGAVVEMPSEPEGSSLMARVHHTSYPVRESGGIIWAYMGPPDLEPDFPEPQWADAKYVVIGKLHEEANWAQAYEGTIDSAHTSSLHSASVMSDPDSRGSTNIGGSGAFTVVRPSADKAPRIRVQYTGYGLRYAAIRTPFKNPETTDYVRVSAYVAPYATIIPPQDNFLGAHIFVPIDDYNSMFYFVAWSDTVAFDNELWLRENYMKVGTDLDENYKKSKRTRANNYLQDRAAMARGDFTGIEGIPNQDQAMQESMGAIVDRTKENLGASDVAIVRFRNLMIHAARRFAEGEMIFDPSGSAVPLKEIRSFEGLVGKDADWKTMAVTPEEIASYRPTTFAMR